MPTGYTAILTEREVTFPEFAMRCARAFGALVDLWEDPLDAPIPQEFQVSDYYKKSLDDAERERREWNSLPADQQLEYAKQEILDEINCLKDGEAKNKAENSAYDAMLQKVERWIPPSGDHLELKNFMREQINKSRDTGDYYRTAITKAESEPPELWVARHSDDIVRSVQRARKRLKEGQDRTALRNLWLKQLRDSLEVPE